MATRILVVEDDAIISEVIGTLLIEQGYVVGFASNGFEALASLMRAPVDLVISDIYMPLMDGIEMATELVRRGDLTPILFMSAGINFAMPSLGMRFLPKPFEIDQLLEVLTEMTQPL